MKKRIIFLLIFCLSSFNVLFSEENDEEITEEFIIDEEADLALSDDVEELNLEALGANNSEDEEKLIAAVDNLGPTASGFTSESDGGPPDDEFVDPRVLRDFIESKGLINCRQKEGTLTIAGDVRARWMSTMEEVEFDDVIRNGKVRGSGTKVAKDRYKSEVNLFLDYVAPRGWSSTKLKWSNFLGADGGTATKTELERAFIGFQIYDKDDIDFYIEVGRTKLDNLFESRVEFSTFFDGIHLFYSRCWPTVGTFTIHGGPFIVDSFTNHYAWVIETFITKWRGTGWSFKYSLIDWHRHARTLNYGNRANPFPAGTKLKEDNPRYRFIVSQMLFGYERKIDWLGCKTLFAYGAVLVNHDAKRSPQTRGKKLNGAWYAGFTLGKLCKACDWSVDINYQYVQAQAVPEFDLAGFGHGNALNGLLSDAILLDARRFTLFTNYKGWQLNLLYALTDSLTLRAKAEWSNPIKKSVGGDFFYKNFEMSAIFAF